MSSDPLSDAEVERARLLIGVDFPSAARHPVSEASVDAIRNFARACGNDDPLHGDVAYGAQSRWGSVIAPAMMAGLINAPLAADPPDAALLAKTAHLFENCHAFVSGGEWLFFQPIRPGDALFTFEADESFVPKPSRFGGRSVHAIKRRVKLNQRGEVVAVNRVRRILSPRRDETSAKVAESRGSYTEADLARIDAIALNAQRRGEQPRFFEDVNVGDSLGEMVKGPLTTTDVILFLAAGGFGFATHVPSALELAARDRAAHPRYYAKTPAGFFDVNQRMHWDAEHAQALGHPAPYDYGVMRESYLLHFLTDWAGDDAWVLRVQDEMRKFNYVGDTQVLNGEVTGLRRADGLTLADVSVSMRNQLGEETLRGQATIALPSRDGREVLPPVDADLESRAAAIWARHAALAT